MPSIAQMLIDKYNGVNTIPPVTPTPVVDVPAKLKKAPRPVVVMTEGQLKNKEMLRTVLKVGIWTIEFNKMDGTPAAMECTLDPKFLPPIDPAKINVRPRNEEPEAPHLLHVYATDRQGWRSFSVPNVTKIYRKTQDMV